MRTRWVTVGSVWHHSVMFQNWGVPNAIELNWLGRPHTFLEWDHLFWAVRRRIELNGLQLVAVASSVQKNLYGQPSLLALVARGSKARQPAGPAASCQNSAAASPGPQSPVDRFSIPPALAIV